MPEKPHGYKVNQAHEVSLREGALGCWASRMNNLVQQVYSAGTSLAVAGQPKRFAFVSMLKRVLTRCKFCIKDDIAGYAV